jgi:hypothetical protein
MEKKYTEEELNNIGDKIIELYKDAENGLPSHEIEDRIIELSASHVDLIVEEEEYIQAYLAERGYPIKT